MGFEVKLIIKEKDLKKVVAMFDKPGIKVMEIKRPVREMMIPQIIQEEDDDF